MGRQFSFPSSTPSAPFGQEFFPHLEYHNWLRSTYGKLVASLHEQARQTQQERPVVAPSQPGLAPSSLQSPVSWLKTDQDDNTRVQLVYHGPLSGSDLRLRYGFDGWQDPIAEVALEEVEAGLLVNVVNRPKVAITQGIRYKRVHDNRHPPLR